MERGLENSQIKSELEDTSEVNYEVSDSLIKTEVFHNYDYEDQLRTTKRKSNPAHDYDPLAYNIIGTNVYNKYKNLVLCLKKLTKKELEMYQYITKRSSYGSKSWNKKIECKICGKIMNSRHSMLNHVKNHLGLTFNCDVCHKKFTWKSNLNDHKITHHNHKVTSNLFPCPNPKCGKVFKRKYQLDAHLRTVHDSSKLPCHQCDKSFKLASQLTNHVNTVHLGLVTRKECPICDMSIIAYNLKKHMKKHSDSSKLPCHQCDKSFKLESKLTNHVNTVHLGIWYPCDVCTQTFARPARLKVHKLRCHSNKMNDSMVMECCKICFKMVKSSIIENHGKYHSGENTFLCEICYKSTPSRSAFYAHNSKWHNIKDQPKHFRCSKCPKIFKYRVNFETHEKSHDGIDTLVLKKENPDPKEIENECILGL